MHVLIKVLFVNFLNSIEVKIVMQYFLFKDPTTHSLVLLPSEKCGKVLHYKKKLVQPIFINFLIN